MILLTLLVCSFAALALGKPNLGVVGGVDAVKGEFPYIVALLAKNEGRVNQYCGGTILTKSWFVTAGHCAEDMSLLITANAGIIDLNDNEAQQRRIVNYTINPNYKKNPDHVGDIAVVKVEPPFEFNEFVQPAKVPKIDADPDLSKNVTLAGWGDVDNYADYSNILQKVQLPLIKYDACMDIVSMWSPNDAYKYNNTEVCTGPISGGRGPCYGDSGGPLTQDGVLIGVVSWGTNGCANIGSIALYPKVSSFINWIQDTIDEELTFA
ncbi:unnamed protein product [Diabrotica balteata]|uniref:Peptidase S1 domain-containing protein n=1 Tax=Diabrotica balteata TaxID=107213 RepID=A0A9N9SRI5_DIABA|nr:unnamed protein product [Diabrotica balteata]